MPNSRVSNRFALVWIATLCAAKKQTVQIDPWGSDAVRIRIGGSTTDAGQGYLYSAPPFPTPTTKSNIAATVLQSSGLVVVTRVSDGAVLLKQSKLASFGAYVHGWAAMNITFDTPSVSR